MPVKEQFEKTLSHEIQYPDITAHSNMIVYFTEFKRLNVAKGLSYRMLTKRIKWPLGYLEDLIKGRRALTIDRAIQFAETAKFTKVETNRLIFMGLAAGKKGRASAHFQRALDMELSLQRKFNASLPMHIYNDPEYGIIRRLIQWGRGSLSIEDVPRYLRFCNNSDQQLKKMTRELLDLGLIQDKAGLLYADDNEIQLDNASDREDVLKKHDLWSRRFLAFTKKPQSPAYMDSGVIELCQSDFLEAMQRIIMLRNWFKAVSEVSAKGPLVEGKPSVLMQYDLNFYSIMDTQNRNVGSFQEALRRGK